MRYPLRLLFKVSNVRTFVQVQDREEADALCTRVALVLGLPIARLLNDGPTNASKSLRRVSYALTSGSLRLRTDPSSSAPSSHSTTVSREKQLPRSSSLQRSGPALVRAAGFVGEPPLVRFRAAPVLWVV